MGKLQEMLDAQRDLQIKHMEGKDPHTLEGDERASFFTTHAFAMTDEVHEAGNEIGWKPWASDRSLNRFQYVGELIDAWHFFMNLLLLAGVDENEMYDRYMNKRAINVQRQLEGYDGVTGKCGYCHRDLLEVNVAGRIRHTDYPGLEFCHELHLIGYHNSRPLVQP